MGDPASGYDPALTVVVMTRGHNARLFGNSAQGEALNLCPGES
jgi:hypothetical protein